MGFFDFLKQPDINRGVQAFKATKGAVLLDVRTPQEFREGHIPESRAEAALHSMCNSCSLFFFCGCPFPQTYRPSFHCARWRISCAVMLTAISAGVSARMARPMGVVIRARSLSVNPSSRS